MIDYNEDCLLTVIFRLKGSVFLRSGSYAIPASVFACLIVILGEQYPSLFDSLAVASLTSSVLWAASTAVLLGLLTFRTNRAMGRFWEGTGLLHQMRGEWFDSVSCCVTFSRTAVDTKPSEVKRFRHTIVRLMSLCHGSALEEIAGENAQLLETIDAYGLCDETLQHLQECNHVLHFNRVEVLLHLIQTLITKSLEDGVLLIPPPILSRVYQTLSRGFVNLLNAKKIADTRFPFPYAQVISLFLLLHLLLSPMMVAAMVRSKIWAPVFTFLPLFGMCALNFVGVELENPFGEDDNDLPLEHFQAEMNTCLLMLLHEHADLVPTVSSKRCVTDFDVLHEQVMSNNTCMTTSSRLRASRFASLSNIFDEDHAKKKTAAKSGSIVSLNPGDSVTTSLDRSHTTQSLCDTSASSEAPVRALARALEANPLPKPPLGAAPECAPRSALQEEQRTGRSASIPSAGGLNLCSMCTAQQSRPTQVLEPKSIKDDHSLRLQPHLLAKSVDTFNDTLQLWTPMVKDQIAMLSTSVEALRDFSDTTRAALVSVQVSSGGLLAL
eukprot:TRINITY_DN41069_c0_g1_i1.p1 TRINITY_DN41069_c0_g1~~TRINITY_DN41069_c0_g1_i1.p1  ORF type:complete len:552 (-),score=70.84 TRINITY_DN41069_c0_g1_i1:639-2294(-)